jgi:hypothetical protein
VWAILKNQDEMIKNLAQGQRVIIDGIAGLLQFEVAKAGNTQEKDTLDPMAIANEVYTTGQNIKTMADRVQQDVAGIGSALGKVVAKLETVEILLNMPTEITSPELVQMQKQVETSLKSIVVLWQDVAREARRTLSPIGENILTERIASLERGLVDVQNNAKRAAHNTDVMRRFVGTEEYEARSLDTLYRQMQQVQTDVKETKAGVNTALREMTAELVALRKATNVAARTTKTKKVDDGPG